MFTWKKIRNIWQEFKKTLGLSLVLAQIDFKLRNEGSYLGILWYLLNPFLMFALLWFIFSSQLGQNIYLYPAYLLLGLITFNFFQQATNESANIILASGGLIKSTKFPYQSLVLAVVFRSLFSHIFEIIVFIGFLLFLKINFLGVIFYPLFLFFYLLFVCGVSLMLAIITVYIIDFSNIWRFFSLLLWFATPIFYSSSYAGPAGQIINTVNPIYYFITIFRDLLIYAKIPSLTIIIIPIFYSLATFIISGLVFNRLKYKMAEKI
ncbi:MAG: ABC transporter permease [Patescibacteria group bacterium]|jgi:ABC-type polysaccharide/polyol phosphate export permease